MKGLPNLSALWETAISIIPLTAILAALQIFILKKPLHNVRDFIIGFILSVLGLHLFLKGTTMSLIPLGDSVGRNFVIIEKKWIILVIGFVIGYAATLVEPGLKALALEVEELSQGAIPHMVLIHGVAVGFGCGMTIGLLKILLNLPYIKVLVPLLLIVILLSFFAPEPFGAIAFDAASATTGPVNIPINMALAVGLASVIKGVDPLISGFGIVGLTSIGSMISVMILGILTKI
ncbi:DUF1538 domain-containing protein [Tissierella carlieri]|jgi:hypothetical protein|uniref:DUF1538 domain-containing protein n=1 Tax=Tissierella carlieri TaxID=689904 RepID=A0ABT1SAD9_9FIRM|nr:MULTISPECIES: DUF1538 domain-containing protein [Tissierella]MBU5312871.1 DUF1538 domain-containing protein [Tissierella carlieri]MCQ4923419.1 DUF1538 domain-containing protein [Tissierella carlieri]MDU5082530.1 DUF1538 domain-containing protein [Bacillota bacterium]OZV11129.1 hypothetical protein CIW83_16200 [Tissierella sp. P1]